MKNSTIKPKEKACVECGTKFMPSNSLEKTCPKYDCRCSFALKVHAKQKAAKEKAARKETKAQREKLKTLSDYEKDAKRVFQKFIRLRDSNESCISCGTTKAKEWHASHYFDCNKYSGLIFDETNVHKSCDYCNVFLHGNLLEYRTGLLNRFGDTYLAELENKALNARFYKFTKLELTEIKNVYMKKIKDLNF